MGLFLLGALIGMAIVFIIGVIRYTFAGLLLFYQSDKNERPYLFLELNDEIEKIIRKKYVVFRVKEDARQ